MVDIHVRRLRPLPAIVRAHPLARVRVAVRADVEVRAVPVQDGLARVAVSGDGVPVWEEVAVVAVLGTVRGGG